MRKLLLATGLLLVVGALLGSRWERWVVAALAPRAPFDASAAPPAPDYSDAAAWTAHPERRDPADVAPAGLRAVEQTSAAADVFYLHPTTYLGSSWNGPVDDPELNAQTDELATLIQASAFNGCCAVYGPRYRQAHGMAFVQPGPSGAPAIDLAYGDVLKAFRLFLEHSSRGRAFILAGHSQGSVLAARLLEREIAGSELRKRLVAAYLIGGPIPAASETGVPACAAPEQTGRLAAWNARGPRFAGSVFDFDLEGQRLCVNPLSWRHDEAPAGAELNEGAVFLHAGDGARLRDRPRELPPDRVPALLHESATQCPACLRRSCSTARPRRPGRRISSTWPSVRFAARARSSSTTRRAGPWSSPTSRRT